MSITRGRGECDGDGGYGAEAELLLERANCGLHDPAACALVARIKVGARIAIIAGCAIWEEGKRANAV